jgi:hypothetical protein
LLLGLSPAALACQDQQYVSPDTVLLSITDKSTDIELVHRCNYVPILLGGEVKARYVVDGDLKATIDIDREHVTLSYEGSGDLPQPWSLSSKLFEGENTCTQGQDDCDPDPVALPDDFNYFVVLSSPCKIDSDE